MKRSALATRNGLGKAPVLALLVFAAGLLAGCETDGTGPGATAAPTAQTAQAPKPPEPAKPVEAAKPAETPKVEAPMTRSRAATECWMRTEKGSAKTDLDKRADVVTKCIDDKMKAAAAPKA
jgi:hypothetical protein